MTMATIPRKTLRLPPRPRVAPFQIGGQTPEKVPREWTTKKPDINFIALVFDACKSQVERWHGVGHFSLAVNDFEPPQLAFSWTSNDDDLILIFPTHSKTKRELSATDLQNLRKSVTWEFENQIAIAWIKKKRVGYQFLQIEKVDGEFNFALSSFVDANLWSLLFNEETPKKSAPYDNAYIEGLDIVVSRKTKSLSITDFHQYRLPLNQISDRMKEIILGRAKFARIVPHGHLHQVNGEKLIDRHAHEPHPCFKRLWAEYEGKAIYLRCHQCGHSMVAFLGDELCGLCATPVVLEQKKETGFEHGKDYFKIIRQGPRGE